MFSFVLLLIGLFLTYEMLVTYCSWRMLHAVAKILKIMSFDLQPEDVIVRKVLASKDSNIQFVLSFWWMYYHRPWRITPHITSKKDVARLLLEFWMVRRKIVEQTDFSFTKAWYEENKFRLVGMAEEDLQEYFDYWKKGEEIGDLATSLSKKLKDFQVTLPGTLEEELDEFKKYANETEFAKTIYFMRKVPLRPRPLKKKVSLFEKFNPGMIHLGV